MRLFGESYDAGLVWLWYLVVTGIGVAVAWWRNRPKPPTWTDGILDGIERLGLIKDPYGAASADGEVEGVALHLSIRCVDGGGELTLRVLAPLPSDLRFTPEALGGSAQDLRVGDPAFDRVVRVMASDPARALAVLDPATRDAIATAVSNGAQFTGEGWARTWPVSLTTPWGTELARTGRAIARAHKAVAQALPRRPIEGTIERLRSDRAPGVRRHALDVLCDRGLATPKLLEGSLDDLDPELRLAVATRLEAWDVVTELVRTGSRTWRVRAAERLAAEPTRIPADARDELQDVLSGALTDDELATVGAEVLARIGDPRVLPALLAAASSGPPGAREAARAAAAAVRARYAHSAGGLALVAGAEVGALSVAAGGALTLTDDPATS